MELTLLLTFCFGIAVGAWAERKGLFRKDAE